MAGPHAGNRSRPAYSGQQRFRFPRQVIELFKPRKPVEFKPPPRRKRLRPMGGVAAYVAKFETPAKQVEGGEERKERKVVEKTFETPAHRRFRGRKAALEVVKTRVEKARKEWDPVVERDGVRKTGDAFRTLFVANLPRTVLECRLRDEFELFGPVTDVIMPCDGDGVPRGYAFIEFERERDLKVAYKDANGRKLDGRRMLVDVERGRTVKAFLPNRLDGPNNSCARAMHRPDGGVPTPRRL